MSLLLSLRKTSPALRLLLPNRYLVIVGWRACPRRYASTVHTPCDVAYTIEMTPARSRGWLKLAHAPGEPPIEQRRQTAEDQVEDQQEDHEQRRRAGLDLLGVARDPF